MSARWGTAPRGRGSSEQWDSYWREQFERAYVGFKCFPYSLCEFAALNAANRPNRSILLVGNGISQEPRAYAALGFEAVALDCSEVAIKVASTYKWHIGMMKHFVALGPGSRPRNPDLAALLDLKRVPTFVTGDLFDSAVCQGPFDIVSSDKTIQLLDDSIDDAIDALLSRLHFDGMLILGFINDRSSSEKVRALLLNRGLVELKVGDQWWAPEISGRRFLVYLGSG